MEAMTHSEAIDEMATERYLLDELTPEQRDAFEEHLFECQECAMDVRAGAVFMDEAKVQLPQLAAAAVAPKPRASETPSERRKPWWSLWTMPAFAAPAFAALLAVIAYQNLATIPALRSASTQPRVVPWTMVHAGTRGTEPTRIEADRHKGAMVLIDLPMQPVYASYAFELFDPQGKSVWAQTVQRAGQGNDEGMTVSLLIPAAGLKQTSYTLNISGISPQGAQTEIERRALEVHFDE
jgi:hypothetical protein